MLVAAGWTLGIAGSFAQDDSGPVEPPGLAALGLECPDGDMTVVGEAIYPATLPEPGLGAREALREFLRNNFRKLLALKFATQSSLAGKIQLAAERDGSRIASVLLTRTPDGVRPEGAAVCESSLEGR
ncbi:MAG TPA: hypothetical protein VD766_04885 [Solirubrobacterales bacterium]|nr:hypothetical protein [Solirubrobacterales bacterium]